MVKAICPHCGADQLESSMAVSTFCRNCGEHFKLSPVPKSAGFSLGGLFGGRRKTSVLNPSVSEPGARSTPALRSGEDEGFAAEDIGDGEVSQRREPAIKRAPDHDSWGEGAVEVTSSGHVVVEGPSALPPSGKPFKPKQHSPTDRAVPCVDCKEISYISPHATSTICPHCSAYVSLQNFDIRNHRRENIKTRGDVTIHKKASLTATGIVCSKLTVYGQVSGKIDCAGDAFFKSSGKVIGSMRCKNLTVHKSSNLEFIPGIRAETAQIDGKVSGDIICEGTINISKKGAVIGDCIAPSIKMEDGGVLEGQMRIMAPDKQLDADYTRRAEEAQEELFAEDEAAEGN